MGKRGRPVTLDQLAKQGIRPNFLRPEDRLPEEMIPGPKLPGSATTFDPPLTFDTSTLDHPFYKEKTMLPDTTMGPMGLTSSHDSESDPDQYLTKAKDIVRNFVDSYLQNNPEHRMEMPHYEVYIVWFSKVLKNWKAVLSTSLPDGRIYEVTYNGEKAEAYLDSYMKTQNAVFADDLGRGLPR